MTVATRRGFLRLARVATIAAPALPIILSRGREPAIKAAELLPRFRNGDVFKPEHVNAMIDAINTLATRR